MLDCHVHVTGKCYRARSIPSCPCQTSAGIWTRRSGPLHVRLEISLSRWLRTKDTSECTRSCGRNRLIDSHMILDAQTRRSTSTVTPRQAGHICWSWRDNRASWRDPGLCTRGEISCETNAYRRMRSDAIRTRHSRDTGPQI